MSNQPSTFSDHDPTAADRKKDHIELAFKSQVDQMKIDQRFYYEPVLAGHPKDENIITKNFLGKVLHLPIWVSSMTGGTARAATINKNLARACGEFGMSMGLGSCRSLLTEDTYLADFQVRSYMQDQPLYANLGIAQVQQLLDSGQESQIKTLVDKLEADGLIIHINPLQEWLQPEGDRYFQSPLHTITQLLDRMDIRLIVKEVGHGMGPKSLEALLDLPLEAVEFAASGGTNFSKIELARADQKKQDVYDDLCFVGHDATEMVQLVNKICLKKPDFRNTKQIIISGGIKNFLDGYYLTQTCHIPAIYGQAAAFLRHAMGSYEALQAYVETQKQGLLLAHTLLQPKNTDN